MPAGPNGAGKSTAAAVLFREVIAVSDFVSDFVSADVIAAEQSPSDPASVAVGACCATRKPGSAFDEAHMATNDTPYGIDQVFADGRPIDEARDVRQKGPSSDSSARANASWCFVMVASIMFPPTI